METEFIEEIVKKIYHKLGRPLKITLPLLLGMDDYVKFITLWLKDGSSHTGDVLTILGMGGIGKTTLARYCYGLHCYEYTSGFIEDISRRCAQSNGLLDVQKQLCDDISKKSSIHFHDVSVYTSKIENALARKKVLLVLDDVDTLDQLDALLGKKGFHSESKIIITTKDASLTERCALFKTKDKPKHTVCTLKGLSEDASMKLLCLHAFTRYYPNDDYKYVSRKLARYCEGHPLALKVMGKSLQNRDAREWEDSIDRLRKEIDSNIEIEMSFDALPGKNDKNLFKHIACFFVGKNRVLTETILRGCGINTLSGINNLIDRCLLSIGSNNTLIMHQLLQEMGRGLVRQESPEKLWKRSRIWCHAESFKVLKRKKGTENILGLTLDTRMLENKKSYGSFELNTDALNRMDSLMLLQLNYVQMKGSYDNFPEELRWLCMHGSPLTSIPLELRMENLVVLDMSYSNIESFGMYYCKLQPPEKRHNQSIGSNTRGKRLLGSLKILVLSFCEQLHSLGGFFEFPELERLLISNCTSLTLVCESIKHCIELVFIDMSNCKKIKKLPRTIGMLKVKTILSDGCDLSVFPIEIRDMDSLQMLKANNDCINSQTSSSASVEVIPRDLSSFMNSLPISLVHLSLINNNLSDKTFPMDFSRLSLLKKLYLDGNPIVSMPSCVRTLPRLEILSMRHCKMLETVEHPPSALRELKLGRLSRLRKITFDPEMSPLTLGLALLSLQGFFFVIEGMVKIQPLGHVEDDVLRCLGWVNLELRLYHLLTAPDSLISHRIGIRVYYEFGIFSTIYWGKEMPIWISYKSKESSISITIPSSPNKLRGLNLCYVQETLSFLDQNIELPMIIINNITKNRTWIYSHCTSCVNVTEMSLVFLSHWMFGKNEMEDGDQLTISIVDKFANYGGGNRECGVDLVYDNGRTQDVLGYYKSWNHIIGGDLSAFQTTTGEYILFQNLFLIKFEIFPYLHHSIAKNARSKGERIRFRAFSQHKYDELCGTPKVDQFSKT